MTCNLIQLNHILLLWWFRSFCYYHCYLDPKNEKQNSCHTNVL